MSFTPLNGGIKIQSGAVVGQRDALNVFTAQDAPPHFERGTQRAALCHTDRVCWLGQPALVIIINIHIPSIRIERAIFKGLKLIGNSVHRQHIAAVKLIIDASDVASIVHLHP